MKRLLSLLMLVSLMACGERADWKGWVYPNRDDLTSDVPLGRFTSLEECRATATEALFALKALQGDYECGFKCKLRPELGLSVCERTEK
ncbi:hypothetical protein [uncultured Brevundimonas sp.]|uniref:hypothetical protein n=1 Tax=uncultured Brevundimonas sp. TaxID=213418 RepID=UPI00261FEDB2|nr:hypothetical protein [uncultured Brevundimonas sp.]